MSSNTIILEEEGKLISDEKELVEIFNNHYVNIVENATGAQPSALGDPSNPDKDEETVRHILEAYKDNPIIIKIKEKCEGIGLNFKLPLATKEEINSIIKKLNTNKATGNDTIPPKLVKLSADFLDEPLTLIINNDISLNRYSENAKTANVPPIFKKDVRSKKANYRPVSLLNVFSKISERYVEIKLKPFIDQCLSKFISAYRKNYSSSHVLIKLIEDWKKALDNGKFVGAVLMDLSKAFDCVPHDLLIAKLAAYGVDNDTLVFFYSYLKRRKQNVKINNIFSTFQILLSGVPQGSILGPILFNLFINDLFLWIEDADLHNYADDNTISAFADSIKELKVILEQESNRAIKWFEDNDMFANADNFFGIIINRCGRHNDLHTLSIGGLEITTKTWVNLLGIDIDYKLNFSKYIGQICKKAAGQLNAICRISSNIGQEEKKVLLESFVNSNFNYCPLVWLFCSPESTRKIDRIQERALRLLFDDYTSDSETIRNKANKSSICIERYRKLSLEIFKTLNNLNPEYMKDIFVKNQDPYGLRNNSRHQHDLKNQGFKAFTYGESSLRVLGPKVWNSLPQHFKSEDNLATFKQLIKAWGGYHCRCKMCKKSNPSDDTDDDDNDNNSDDLDIFQ